MKTVISHVGLGTIKVRKETERTRLDRKKVCLKAAEGTQERKRVEPKWAMTVDLENI